TLAAQLWAARRHPDNPSFHGHSVSALWTQEEYVDGYGNRWSCREPIPIPGPYVGIVGDRLEFPWGSASVLRLDPTAGPKRLTIRSASLGARGKTYRGIYKLDGDTLTICTETAGPGWPESFEPRTPGAVLEVYYRVQADTVRRIRETQKNL